MTSIVSDLLADDWPLPSFHFQVLFHDLLFTMMDMSFQEVSGLDTQLDTEEYREGGGNNVVYHLPKAVKFTPLVLKRSIHPLTSPLVNWCKSTFSSEFSEIKPIDLTVMLLNEYRLPVRTWSFTGAYPVSWKVDSFHATKNEVAIEEIQLCYNQSSRVL